MSKRTIIIAIACLVVILGIGGYLIISRTKAQPQVTVVPPANSSANPFGQSSENITLKKPTTETSVSTAFNTTGKQAALVKIVDAPTAGGAFIQNGGRPTISFVDRITGNTFSFNTLFQTLSRVTNTTLPDISHSYWANNGAAVILQSVRANNTINTYSAKFVSTNISSTTRVSEIGLQGSFLPSGIGALAVSPSTSKIFYLVPQSGGVNGFVANPDGTKAAKIFSAPLTEWLVSWPQESTIVLTTKPSSNVPGHSYALNAKTGSITEILGNIAGLTVLANPAVTKIAYSDANNALNILSPKDNATTAIALSTLAEKCVWSKKAPTVLYCAVPNSIPAASYPDAWYQGLVSFTDSIYKIDTAAGTTQVISRPFQDFNQSIDATNLSLSANEDYLLFTNKKDYTLWSLNIGQ